MIDIFYIKRNNSYSLYNIQSELLQGFSFGTILDYQIKGKNTLERKQEMCSYTCQKRKCSLFFLARKEYHLSLLPRKNDRVEATLRLYL